MLTLSILCLVNRTNDNDPASQKYTFKTLSTDTYTNPTAQHSTVYCKKLQRIKLSHLSVLLHVTKITHLT